MTQPSARPTLATRPIKSLRRGALLNWLSVGVNFTSSFVLTPVILHRLGASGFGMWALILSFSGYYGLVNMGLGSALLRFICRDLAIRNFDSLQETISSAMLFFSCTGFTILLAAIAFRRSVSHFFNIADADTNLFEYGVLIVAASVVVDFYGAVITSCITAFERFELLTLLSVGRQTVQATGTLLVALYFPSILSISLVMFVGSLLALAASSIVMRQMVPEIGLTRIRFNSTRLNELFRYGGSTVLLNISNLARLRLGNLVLARTAGVAAVADFSIAANLITTMTTIISSSTNVLNPRFSLLDAQGDRTELARIYRSALFVSAIMAFGLGSLLFLFAEGLMRFWLGKELPGTVGALRVLAVTYSVALCQAPGWNMMYAKSKHHFMARVSLAEAGAIIVLGLWLSSKYGVVGFAIATATVMLIVKVAVQPAYAAHVGGLTLRQYLEPLAAPAIVAAMLCAACVLGGLESALRAHGITFFLLVVAGFSLSYLVLICALCLHKPYMPRFLGKYLSLLPS